MTKELPKIDPVLLANRQADWQGQIPINQFQRLSGLLANNAGQASVAMKFYHDDQRHVCISGHIDVVLQLICQRCMELMDLPIHIEFNLAVVHSMTEAKNLPDELEPLLLTAPQIAVGEIVEEELLLSVPYIPKHNEKECAVQLPLMGKDVLPEMDDKEHPFAKLKQKNRKS